MIQKFKVGDILLSTFNKYSIIIITQCKKFNGEWYYTYHYYLDNGRIDDIKYERISYEIDSLFEISKSKQRKIKLTNINGNTHI